MTKRVPLSIKKSNYRNWDEVFANPKPVTVESFSTGTMIIRKSGILNLKHGKASMLIDENIFVTTISNLVHHELFGYYLIDTGLDSSYSKNPYGSMKGLLVKAIFGKAHQKDDENIISVLDRKKIKLNGVFLTHLHPDHIAGVLDLPKDINYIAGKNESYLNYKFFVYANHLKGVDALNEIDFSKGKEMSPLGKSVDIFQDGSLWAISTAGHTKGHVSYLINGIKEKVLITGDACNTLYQFKSDIGPGRYSNNVKKAQEVLDQLIEFKNIYPDVRFVFGHDLQKE